jgi:hypothetical protein
MTICVKKGPGVTKFCPSPGWVIMVKQAAPSLCSNIPQTALVAALENLRF